MNRAWIAGWAAAWIGLASLAAGAAAQAVPADAKAMSFDVVSVRENKNPPGAMPVFGPTPDGYHATGMPLILPLLTAYVPQTGGATFYTEGQISGLPDWVTRDRFDIDAKVSEADQAEWQKPASQPAMLRAMLQTALAERCKLAVHRNTKEVSVMFLEVGKNGPKFKETNPAEEHPGGITLPFGGILVPNRDGMNLYGASMASLATLLSGMGNRGAPIVDKTGLTGKYDLVLKRPEGMGGGPGSGPGAGPGGGPGSQPGAMSASDPGAPMFSVEALGLKLQSGKSIVETLVIDHMERPSAN